MKVSVVVPVYNGERYLRKAIESVLTTSYRDLEILIVEDGSSDGSLRLARLMENEYAGIVRLIQHDDRRNQGAGASRNLGIRSAKGEVIAFLDADDEYLPCRFNISVEKLVDNAAIDGVYEKARIVTQDGGNPVTVWTNNGVIELQKSSGADILRATLSSSWHMSAITLKKRAFLKAGYFNTKLLLSQDSEMWFRLAMTCTLVEGNSTEPVAIYRRHPGNRSFPENNSRSIIPALGHAIRFARRRQIALQRTRLIEESFHQKTTHRLGMLVDNGNLREAWFTIYWIVRMYPHRMIQRHILGNVWRLVFFPMRNSLVKRC